MKTKGFNMKKTNMLNLYIIIPTWDFFTISRQDY